MVTDTGAPPQSKSVNLTVTIAGLAGAITAVQRDMFTRPRLMRSDLSTAARIAATGCWKPFICCRVEHWEWLGNRQHYQHQLHTELRDVDLPRRGLSRVEYCIGRRGLCVCSLFVGRSNLHHGHDVGDIEC